MQLQINGAGRHLVPLQDFQERWGLPAGFGITYFELKDWEVGRLDTAGQNLVNIKQEIIEAAPKAITPPDLLLQPPRLAAIFRQKLQRANAEIGLSDDQLDFAVDGLENVLHDVVYQLIGLYQTHRGNIAKIQEFFDFAALYQKWLDNSVTLFAKSYAYSYAGTDFKVKIISYAYGRVGLQVQIGPEVYYVFDPRLACPAWRYMENLCEEIAQTLSQALTDS